MTSPYRTSRSHKHFNNLARNNLGRWCSTLVIATMAIFGATIFTASITMAATATVKMTDTPAMYQPMKVTIKSGDTVEWDNNASSLHTVTFDASKAQVKTNVILPAGVAPFDSGFMMPGGTFSHQFTTPGEYKYFCIPHEKDGMIGYVTVTK